MNNRATRRKSRPRRLGVGLVELLISLAISAALLTATGAALDASFKAYRTNQEIGDVTQRARLAMHRMLTEIRSTQAHEPSADVLSIYRAGVNVESTSIRIYTDDNNAIEYRQVGSEVLRQTFRRTGGVWEPATAHPILTGVAPGNFSIGMEPQRSLAASRAGTNFDQLRRATIRLTVGASATQSTRTETTNSGQTMSLVSSVVPRRNAW